MNVMKEIGEGVCEVCGKTKDNVREISGEGFVIDICRDCHEGLGECL